MSSLADRTATPSTGRKVCVITGATSGIGRATAIALGQAGVHVALLGRNERAAASVAAGLDRRRPGSAKVFRLDLSDLGDVRRVASEIRSTYAAIDILVNNAGARFTEFGENADGVERTFATNHLGHFLLTALLLDRLLASASARVITIGSSAHAITPTDWLQTRDTYDRRTAYAQSKLANILFAYELARRMQGTAVSSNAFDPGGVATNLGRNNGIVAWLRHLTYYGAKGRLRPAGGAARDVVRLALAKELQGVSGRYFDEDGEANSAPVSHDQAIAHELWALSSRLTGLDAAIGDAWRFVDPNATR